MPQQLEPARPTHLLEAGADGAVGDVMFTDIRMPKMDGIQLVAEVQKMSDKPEIVAEASSRFKNIWVRGRHNIICHN